MHHAIASSEEGIMKVGCGYSTDKSSFVAGAQAAESALAKGNMAHPDLLIGFCSGKLDPAGFFSGMKSTVSSGTPIIGGSAVGVITNDHLSYDGYSSAVAALMLDKIPYQIVTAGDLDRDGRLAGENLAKDISDPFEKNALLIFYDSLKVPATIASPPVMNPSPALIAGIENQLGPDVPILGAGLLSDFDFTIPPRQFGGASVSSNSVVGLLLGRGFTLYSRIMHGCTPLDGVYHRITKGREGVIYEIDNQPAVEMIDAFYGNQAWRQTHPVNLLTIGVNHGKRYEPPNEANYVNRLITGVLPDGSGIGLFEPDLGDRNGNTIHVAGQRENDRIGQRQRRGADERNSRRS